MNTLSTRSNVRARLPTRLGAAALQASEIYRLVAIQGAARRRERIFQSRRAVEQDGPFLPANATVPERLLERRVGGRPLRAHQEALGAGHFVEPCRYRLVVNRNRESAALAHRAQNENVTQRLRYPDARRNGMGVFPTGGVLLAALVGAHHGGAACGLNRHHPRALGADETHGFELGKS